MFALIVFSCASGFAAEPQKTDETGQAVQTDGVAADTIKSGTEAEQETVTCPNCGKSFTVGRHGQEGRILKCPYCGKEICPKEEEKGVCYGADMAFLSKYVARGALNTNGPVFEPDLWVSYKGFTVNAWGNMDLTNINGLGGNIGEWDFSLDYSNSIGKLGYSAGVIYYTFPHTGDDDTSEVYAAIGYDMPLKPKLVVYYDFRQVDGFYGNLSVCHIFELPEVVKGFKPSLALSAQVGLGSRNFNESNFGVSHTAFTDMVLTASLPVSITDSLSVRPTVSYSTVLDRTIRTKNSHNDNVIWGVVLSASL